MSESMFELWALTLIHIASVVIWIGAHLFETFILHSSFRKVPEKSKLEVYTPLFARFRTITGLASASTLYSGVLLSSFMNLGSLSFVLTTPWGLLSSVYFVSATVNHALPLKPSSLTYRSLRMLGTLALIGAALIVIIYLGLPTNLRDFFIYSDSGRAIIIASLLAVLLSRLGIVQGAIRGQISRLATQLLSTEENSSRGSLVEKFHSLERRMQIIVMPETILIFIILALMVYSANPF